MATLIQGLSSEEVLERRARGLGNRVPVKTSRSYFQIIRENVFTFVNNVLIGLGIALVLLGRPSDAFVSVLVILANVLVSVYQEIRAKRVLDRIALLTRPRVTVIREGREQTCDPDEIVAGDILSISPGDQIVSDGQVVGDGRIEVDESLLTGESDLIPKRFGDQVFSGSFCVTGKALIEAKKVGAQSLANQMASEARAFRRILTPLQQQINLMVRVILFLAIFMEILLGIRTLLDRIPLVESVRMSVVIIGLVPNGLFLAISAAYAMGAVRMAGKGALVQQANAIESLSNVDVLCLDKTGTLTTNRIRFHSLKTLDCSESELREVLGDFAASLSSGNRTSDAIAESLHGVKRFVTDEIPFSSSRKYSALSLDEPERRGTFVLGAPEVLRDQISASRLEGQAGIIDEWTDKGLRVLLFAGTPVIAKLTSEDGKVDLPDQLVPLGLISLSDELKPAAQETLNAFTQSGVRLKIISGDNPHTVAALAKQAGFDKEVCMYTGSELDEMDPAEFAQAAEKGDIFGRITPRQKESLVHALRESGHYVAMIGDGVNDVLSLKRSNLGVAMQSGSQAARSVADIVLLGDSFAALPSSLQEGRRIIFGMQDILKLFLTRVFTVTLLILAIGILGSFPYAPKNITILTLLTVGIPSIALAAWARPGVVSRQALLRRLFHFIIPASLTIAIIGLVVFLAYFFPAYTSYLATNPASRDIDDFLTNMWVHQTALTNFTLLCGLVLIVFVEPPMQFLTGGDELSGDWRPTLLALGLLAFYLVILFVPPMRIFFDLAPLSLPEYLVMGAAVILWALLLLLIWRNRWMERFLDIRE